MSRKPIIAVLALFLTTLISGTAYATGITLSLSVTSAAAGSNVSYAGGAVAGSLVPVKIIDKSGEIVYYDEVSADANGAFSGTFVISGIEAGVVTVVAGYGNDVSAQNLTITRARHGGSSMDRLPGASPSSTTINPSVGGTVRLGTEASISIPAGALQGSASATVVVQVVSSPPAAPSGFMFLGQAYQFTVNGQDHYSFNKPVTLTFTFDSAKLAPGETSAVHYYDENQGWWIALPTTVERGTDGKWYAVTRVDHLNKFAVFSAQAQKIITLNIGRAQATVNGSPYTLDGVPFATEGRTMVPIRFISEALGAKVDWNTTTRQVTIKDGGKEIVLSLGSKNALVNGKATAIDCAPVTKPPGRTFVPLRFISETLSATVNYNDGTKQITIAR